MFKEEFYTIYALFEQNTPEKIRYVGVTCQSIEKRLKGHLSAARNNGLKSSKAKVYEWMRDCLRRNENIGVKSLQTSNNIVIAYNLEKEWISYFKRTTDYLCNMPNFYEKSIADWPITLCISLNKKGQIVYDYITFFYESIKDLTKSGGWSKLFDNK